MDTYCGSEANYIVFNSDSIDNLVRAINERLFYCKINGVWQRAHDPLESAMDELQLLMERDLYPHLTKTAPMNREEFLAGYQGRKLQCYIKAADRLEHKPLTARDWSQQGFLKTENLPEDKEIGRVVQTREYTYHFSLGRYTRKVESMIYHALDEMCRLGGGGVKGEKTILKGMNCIEQAKQIKLKWDRFHEPVCVLMDGKRFDQHVKEKMSIIEHNVYLQCFPNKKHKKELKMLLSKQLINKGTGFTSDGKVKYNLGPCRCSGDMNTGLGNCFCMTSIVYKYVKDFLKLRKWAIADNGDDVFVIMEKKHLNKFMKNCYQFFYDHGQVMEIEKPVYQIEHIAFCQTNPVFDGEKYRMVRAPQASLTKDALSITPFNSQMELANYLYSVGMGGISLTGGIPLVQNYYVSMLNNANRNNPTNKKFKDILTERDGFYWQRRGMKEVFRKPTDAARASFAMAFGIPPEVQIEQEKLYDQLEIDWDGKHNLKRGYRTLCC